MINFAFTKTVYLLRKPNVRHYAKNNHQRITNMRDFSDFEKERIRQIVKCEKPCIGDFISDSILVDRGIIIDRQKKEISILHPNTDSSAISDFFDLLSLIEYLENERLIFVHTNPNPFTGNFLSNNWRYNPQINQLTDFNGNVMPPSTKVDIPTNVFDLIIKYVNTFYYPISELKGLVENNFETLEKKQLKESLIQTKYSKWAFYIALFALIFTIGYALLFNSNVELDKQQFEELVGGIESKEKLSVESIETLKDDIEAFNKVVGTKLDTLIKVDKQQFEGLVGSLENKAKSRTENIKAFKDDVEVFSRVIETKLDTLIKYTKQSNKK